MAEVTDRKVVRAYSNDLQVVRVIYDFDTDDGTEEPKELWEASGDVVIHDFYAKGITVLDSASDGVGIDVGIQGGDLDILMDGVVEATFAAGALIKPTIVEGAPNVIPMPLKLADGGIIEMDIQGEALTSGKCEFVFIIAGF